MSEDDEGPSTRIDEAKAPNMPNEVFGTANVMKSLSMKSHIRLIKDCAFSRGRARAFNDGDSTGFEFTGFEYMLA